VKVLDAPRVLQIYGGPDDAASSGGEQAANAMRVYTAKDSLHCGNPCS
jgi:hypothetical protein